MPYEPNSFLIDTERVGSLVVALLQRDVLLPATCLRVSSTDYRGTGGTITLRVPGTRAVQVQENAGDPISYTPVSETPVTFKLSHLYDATQVSDEDLTLAIEDFARQVLSPMVSGIVRGAEDLLADVMNAVTPTDGFTDLSDPVKLEADILGARKLLVDAGVPSGDRFLACGTTVAQTLLTLDKLTRVDSSGTDSALREATIARAWGFTIIESPAIESESMVAYHRSAFAGAFVSPAVPQGAASATEVSDGGIAARVVFDFDPGILSDVCAVSVFAGAKLVDADRVVRISDESPGES